MLFMPEPRLEGTHKYDTCHFFCDFQGWGKNLNYVIAFGLDHVRDVTWKYTFYHLETLGRRNSCRETVLRNFIRVS